MIRCATRGFSRWCVRFDVEDDRILRYNLVRMDSPWIDRLAVWWSGGLRVRVLKGMPQPIVVVAGGLKDLPGKEALELVLELKPDARGVVDMVKADGGKYWKVRIRGPLNEGNFAQQVRNALAAR